MTTGELMGRISAALSERDQLLAYVAKLEAFGGQLANCAYNIKQQTKMSEHERSCLNAAQSGWDETKRMRPRFLETKR